MRTAVVIGDVQAPLHDPSAVAVALEIIEAIKPDIFVANGDWVEFRHLSMRYPAMKGATDKEGREIGATAKEEAATAHSLLGQFARAAGPKCKKIFNEGNHEFRLFRAISQSAQLLEILGLKGVAQALLVDAALGLKELGYQYTGAYPKGIWLFDLQPINNVYVHHGYMTRTKAGYQASAETDKRMVGTVTGHGERLGQVWRRDLTGRDILAVEGGNLSRLGEPEGAEIYTSVPFSQPQFLDRKQGFVVLYQDGTLIQPVCVNIKKGKAIFEGKLYKS